MSRPVTFEPGIQYVLQGVGYQVTQVLNDGTLVARNLATNTHVSQCLDQLLQHWLDNILQFEREGPNLRDIAGTTLKTAYTFTDLADLPPKLQEITWHRYQLIRPYPLVNGESRSSKSGFGRISRLLREKGREVSMHISLVSTSGEGHLSPLDLTNMQGSWVEHTPLISPPRSIRGRKLAPLLTHSH